MAEYLIGGDIVFDLDKLDLDKLSGENQVRLAIFTIYLVRHQWENSIFACSAVKELEDSLFKTNDAKCAILADEASDRQYWYIAHALDTAYNRINKLESIMDLWNTISSVLANSDKEPNIGSKIINYYNELLHIDDIVERSLLKYTERETSEAQTPTDLTTTHHTTADSK